MTINLTIVCRQGRLDPALASLIEEALRQLGERTAIQSASVSVTGGKPGHISATITITGGELSAEASDETNPAAWFQIIRTFEQKLAERSPQRPPGRWLGRFAD